MTWSSWSARTAAIRAYIKAQNASIESRLDLSKLMNGGIFTPPKIPDLTGLSGSSLTTALQGCIWKRYQIVGVPRSGRPLGLGVSAPTRRLGGVLRSIFYPLGYGDEFAEATIQAEILLFQRQTIGGASFGDTDEPQKVEPEEGSKFAQTNLYTPFVALDAAA